MQNEMFGSDLWQPSLDRYADATGLSVELFGASGQRLLGSNRLTPLAALFREYAADPGLFADCASRCLAQTVERPAVIVSEAHGLTVVGASLALDGAIVGAAVGGYALDRFTQVPVVQRWAQSAGVPFQCLWDVARQQTPLPERRLKLHGELLQVLGDTLLRENYRTRQYEETAVQLQQAAAAKDEFLAVLSHELRTPLAAILGWANVLKKTQVPEQVRRAAETIERNVLLESRMVEDLLDVTRIANSTLTLDLKIQELRALVRAAVETSAQDFEQKAIHLEFVDVGEPLFVECDSGRLQQVFRNIISNAVKFTPVGGSICVTLSREADNARVVVADTGEGIAPEFLPFVFRMFRQQEQGTRREHDGLGIGLALVKRLTELHHGTVSVVSAGPGRGAEVTVCLPLAAPAPALNAEAASVGGAEPCASALAGLSILVIEDSEDARESLRTLLELFGAEVSIAHDGREALDRVQDAQPDLVLCDLRMPRMDGFEFMRELQRGSTLANLPVVAMSGFASAADRQRTREAGFVAHIGKPFDAATVVATIDATRSRREP